MSGPVLLEPSEPPRISFGFTTCVCVRVLALLRVSEGAALGRWTIFLKAFNFPPRDRSNSMFEVMLLFAVRNLPNHNPPRQGRGLVYAPASYIVHLADKRETMSRRELPTCMTPTTGFALNFLL